MYPSRFKKATLLKLELSRANLRISEATEQRISCELERLKGSGKATPEILKDYEIYLERVQAMVMENRKIVESMEAVYAKRFGAAKTTSPSSSAPGVSSFDTILPEEQELDELTVFDRELDGSLAEFDEMLLKEMDDIRSRSATKMRELDEEAAAAAERLKDKGVDVSSSSEESASDEQAEGSQAGEADKTREQAKGELEEGQSDAKVGADDSRYDKSRSGEDATYGRPGQPRESGQDDDVVARQLREAAEKETDPELKEKLWKEYEEYKKGGS
jgi:hypothetical protein